MIKELQRCLDDVKGLHKKAVKEVCEDVARERTRQLEKWGIQRHTYQEWRAILDEELAEVACSVIAGKHSGYDELTHVAAVAISWLVDVWLKKEEDSNGEKV